MACGRWGHIFATSANVRPCKKKVVMSPAFAIRGGEYDTKMRNIRQMVQAAFVREIFFDGSEQPRDRNTRNRTDIPLRPKTTGNQTTQGFGFQVDTHLAGGSTGLRWQSLNYLAGAQKVQKIIDVENNCFWARKAGERNKSERWVRVQPSSFNSHLQRWRCVLRLVVLIDHKQRSQMLARGPTAASLDACAWTNSNVP